MSDELRQYLSEQGVEPPDGWEPGAAQAPSSAPGGAFAWMKELQQTHPNLAALLQKAPFLLPLLGIRPAVKTMRSFDSALRPLTAAEVEMAEVYRRILNPPPIKGLPSRKPTAAAEAPRQLERDPPSFLEMWARQGKKD